LTEFITSDRFFTLKELFSTPAELDPAISTVARAEVNIVYLVRGSRVTKHENALLSWYTLKEDKNERTTTDQASTWRLISDKYRAVVIVSMI
jgi:hypothetical protein